MRVTQVMLARGFGGAERSFVDLTLALAARGHEVQAVCDPAFSHARLLATEPRVHVACVRTLGPWDALARRRLHQILAAFAPAVMQAHLARAAHLAGAAARALGVPTLAKTHNYVDLRYYRAIERLVVTTEDQARYLRAQGVAPERIELIPNFSALPPTAPRPRTGGPVRLLAYGRMVPKKGFDVLLRALAALTASAEWRLTLGGDGPQRRRLEREARRLGIAARVDAVGWIDDVRAALLAHDLFVLPSREEPFGIAVLEAMSCGTPVIATRTPGPAEMLDEATGWLVPPGDAAALAEALAAAMGAPDVCLARAGAALDRYCSRYSEPAVVPRYEALYRRLASAEQAVACEALEHRLGRD